LGLWKEVEAFENLSAETWKKRDKFTFFCVDFIEYSVSFCYTKEEELRLSHDVNNTKRFKIQEPEAKHTIELK
jgi:hypothetical protein